MPRECITHHHACECREERFRKMEEALQKILTSQPLNGEDWRWCVQTAAQALAQ